MANGRERRFPSEPLPGWSGFPCPQNFRPQDHGAVSRDACDQIERKAMPKICRVFNEFCPGGAYLIIDVERAGRSKLARLRRRFQESAKERTSVSLPDPAICFLAHGYKIPWSGAGFPRKTFDYRVRTGRRRHDRRWRASPSAGRVADHRRFDLVATRKFPSLGQF